jgi:hypothetical protein
MFSEFLSQYRSEEANNKSGFLSYGSSDYDTDVRKAVFEGKVRKMIAHNSNSANTWKMGINQCSDMTHEEFVKYYHIVGDNQECSATHRPAPSNATYVESILRDVPSHWDWRQFKVVTPVKD